MGILTVRDIDCRVKQKLRQRAAARGVSLEQGVRRILTRSVDRAGKLSPSKRKELTVDEILAFGNRLAEVRFDQKEEFDELWSYLEEE